MPRIWRTGAHGLRELIAPCVTRCIVEEKAPYTACEPNASGRQTSDSDTAAVRPFRRGRRLLAVGCNEHGGRSRRAARAAGAAERKCAGRVERDGQCWRSCTALATFALLADRNSHKRAHRGTHIHARTHARTHAHVHRTMNVGTHTHPNARKHSHACTHAHMGARRHLHARRRRHTGALNTHAHTHADTHAYKTLAQKEITLARVR